MAEGRHNFLQVMGDQDHGWAAGHPAQAFKSGQQMLSGDQVQAPAGFIQDQEARFMDERPCDQETLLLSCESTA